MLAGINDEKGISKGKLEHIMLGTDKNKTISGYHCQKENYGDTRLFAEVKLYSGSFRIISENREQCIFEAVVRSKRTGKLKTDNNGKSTFFNKKWSRQDVVDCIYRARTNKKIIKKYQSTVSNVKQVCLDEKTGLVLIDCNATAYPLLKY